jgi:hypothetical protein
MDADTLENWRKIKAALEKAGKTDCYFYKRAVIICRGGKDPFEDGTAPNPKH